MDKGAELYLEYLSGDKEALAELVREYRDGLILYINGITRDMHEAEDICEETFVSLVFKKPRFGARCTFQTWLYGIARNLAYDGLRRKKRTAQTPLDENTPDTVSVEDAFIKSEAKKRLHKALGKLPPDKYELIWLSYFENMSAKEVAAVTGKSEGAVFTALTRARAELKEILLREGFDYEDL